MQTFSDRIMQFRQEARAVITELQKWHKNDFRIMEPVNKSGGIWPDMDFIKVSCELEIAEDNGQSNSVWLFAISREKVYYIDGAGTRGNIDITDFSTEILGALADWILANHPIQKPGEDKV